MAEDLSGITIIDDRTPNIGLELPHQDNKLIADVQRLRETIYMLDSYLKNLAKVATTGKYADLLEIPAHPNPDWEATSGKAQILNKPNLADVATSGEYFDLKNRPDFDELRREIVLAAHPVGSYYISNSSTSPETLFGGTWTSIRGRFLYAEDDTYPAGITGGNATTTLTVENLPAHNHTATTASAGTHAHTALSAGAHTHKYLTRDGSGDTTHAQAEMEKGTGGYNGLMSSAGAHTHETDSQGAHTHTVTVNNTGAGTSFSNMPPLLGAYVWRRTA